MIDCRTESMDALEADGSRKVCVIATANELSSQRSDY